MNKTELMAFEWLKTSKGYTEDQIIRNAGTPAFVCTDGKRFDSRFLYGKKILFSAKQSKSLRPDDVIIVFDRDKFVSNFLWHDRFACPFVVKIMDEHLKTVFVSDHVKKEIRKLVVAKGLSDDNQAIEYLLEK